MTVPFAVRPQNQIPKLLLSLGLDYIRWTQLTPMLMVWGVAVLMVLALTFVSFQEQTFSALEWLMQWLMQLPIVGERITQVLSDQDSEMHMTTADFKSFMLSAWSVVSLVFMLASMAISALFGPFEPWTLKRKFLIVGIGVGLLLTGMIFNYYAAPDKFDGGLSGWALNFSLMGLMVFLVSAYSLSISHFLLFLNRALFGDNSADTHHSSA